MESSGIAAYKGRLGTTTRASVQVVSDSGTTFTTTIYTSINVDDSSDLLADLSAGSLHRVTDPTTGSTYQLAQPVVLHAPSRHVLAVLLPDGLRHRENDERRRIITELDKDNAPMPRYVREFAVVYSLDAFNELGIRLAEPAAAPVDKAAVETLAIERQQLDELRERFDKERAQMDEIEARLSAERAELHAAREALEVERRRVEAEKLNLEQRLLAQQSGGPASNAEEATQIVSDDQFIELQDANEVADLASEVSEIVNEGIEEFEPDSTMINPLTTGLPSRFSDYKSSGDRVSTLLDDHLVFAARVPRTDIEGLFDGDTEFFVQLHELEGYPLIGVVLANLEDEKVTSSIGWGLDIADDKHRGFLDRLCSGSSVRIGLYEPLGSLLRAVEIQAPLRSNVLWIVDEANDLLDAASGTFEAARKQYEDRSFERVGAMRHPFFQQNFDNLESTSDIKLAAGIMGFWNQPEKLRYVIANRSFPWRKFQAMRDRVIEAAVRSGIFLNKALRDRAVEMRLAEDETKLAELLIANFAEVCVSIRVNDLEPSAQWDNWDALLGLGEELGIPPDSDVVELAEVSLKRAQELAEMDEDPAQEIAAGQTYSVDRTLVVARQSESTGVTYFLPDDASVDSFDDVAGMDREDLELLLDDPKGRLEASQVLLERFGAEAVTRVMEGAETMSSPEVAALARFVETKSDSLEGELVRSLGTMGPSGSYIAVHALSAIRSSTAIPAILDILRDPTRHGDVQRLVRVIAQYGDRLLPALTRAIKRDGTAAEYVELLAAIEDVQGGTLANLSKDRSKVLRDAARLAREKRDVR